MARFVGPLTVTKVGERLWQVERSFSYYIGKEEIEYVIVPQGFLTDFASVPKGFWNIFPPDGEYTQAAVLHDFCCTTNSFPQLKTDRIFYEAMGVLGVPKWKRIIMYCAVRVWHGFR